MVIHYKIKAFHDKKEKQAFFVLYYVCKQSNKVKISNNKLKEKR